MCGVFVCTSEKPTDKLPKSGTFMSLFVWLVIVPIGLGFEKKSF